ncbi:YgjP-like metallopeptidase domain-containing protein [Lysobacter sp. A03]|uniref:M48 metallopeptidase family protein n=1 Tax=Lysobacter sp. A03 TaxID=1199154 RepID=UPI0005B73CFA|nr:YgjP-like metallopeptidase domain-containing protein [Lysobacter sp. A03]KIQ96491.1 putative metal-dependent hydrolase [Lysobacter sp. A03]
MPELKYLAGYDAHLLDQVRALIHADRLGPWLREHYELPHDVRNDGALYEYVVALKDRHMRKAPPLDKVVFDNRLQAVRHALGTHTSVSRVQGSRLKASREIRIAGVFRDAPQPFLRMIVVHELAHLRESAHNKAFYQLCAHMEPDYHQLEFDMRLYLTQLEIERRKQLPPIADAQASQT